jgi:hypothetical protein
MPFAMIDLRWLDGSEYNRFLLWLVPKISGAEGYGGLEQGQLRFSRRELERDFLIGPSHAGFLISKAVSDGLLNPLGKSQKRKGMGEIYVALGDLKVTRFGGEPRLNQDRTKTEPTNLLETVPLDETLNQDRTKTEPRLNRLKDKTKKTIKIIPPKEGMREILEWDGMDYSSVFWEVLKPFPPDKKSFPLTIAKVFRDAIRSEGATPEILHKAAVALSKARDAQYMPDASKWLKEQGWRAYAIGE